MAPDAEKILAEALKLPRDQRAEVVDELIRSLDEDDGDSLDEEDRARLHAAIALSDDQFQAGEGIPIRTALDRLERKP